MIRNIKLSLLLILSTIILSNCGSVQKAFDPQNKNTSEEFLVEKKYDHMGVFFYRLKLEAK